MNYEPINNISIKVCSQNNEQARVANTSDLNLPSDYSIEVYAIGLDSPIGMISSENGDLYIAESGTTSGSAKVLRLRNGRFDIIAENFNIPVTGINYLDGKIYISHKGSITVINSDGSRQDLLSGLPCNGDYGISNVAFGPDGKIYFGIGTATNSGVVGEDNEWVFDHPLLHDVPPFNIALVGQNYVTNNILNANTEKAYTGDFSAYGVPNTADEKRKGVLKASGSILRFDRDGTNLELVASGLRNPVQIQFDRRFQLYAANRGYDVRGSRPIANAPDEFFRITAGTWYGWPDFSAGEPVTDEKFRPEGGSQPEFILASHPSIPPKPLAVFPAHSTIMGFDFSNSNFSSPNDIYIAEFGSFGPITMGASAPYLGIGYKISRINIRTGEVATFINNKSGIPAYRNRGGGFGRPVDIIFEPDGTMYILDMGISDRNNPVQCLPYTGVIWRVRRIY
jgi:glucose/arabinose dehydrogenase